MAFGLGKIAVLESKLSIYEDLSKEMLDKLERAVGTISDNSNKIAIILERHENRLDESERTDDLIIKMIDELKQQEEKNHQILHERIDRIQKKVDANQKFVIGAGAGGSATLAPVPTELVGSSHILYLACCRSVLMFFISYLVLLNIVHLV